MAPKFRRLALIAVAASAALMSARADTPLRTIARARSPRPPQPAYKPGEIIVRFATATTSSLVEHAIRDVGGVAARRSAYGGHYLVTLDRDVSVPQALARFRAMREVEYAEPNGLVRASFTPNDRDFSYQWNFRMIGAQRMWDIQQGDSSVIVAVVDTGIAYEDYGPFRKAPDWGDTRFVRGYNGICAADPACAAAGGVDHANDNNFHGTHVASTIAEGTNNGSGVAGLAFKTSLMPVKVLDHSACPPDDTRLDDACGDFFTVAEGVDFATQNGAKVINLSLGGPDDDTTMKEAVDRAVAAGVVVVAAAGNDGVDTVEFPARLANVISVGAVDGRKQLTFYSNFGPKLDVVAPGGDLERDDDNDGYPDGVLQQTFDPETAAILHRYDDFGLFFVEGTSQATPHVSALAALLIRQGITDPAAVKAAIQSTAEDLGSPGRDDTFGFGLINPEKALSGLGLNQ